MAQRGIPEGLLLIFLCIHATTDESFFLRLMPRGNILSEEKHFRRFQSHLTQLQTEKRVKILLFFGFFRMNSSFLNLFILKQRKIIFLLLCQQSE